MPYEWNFRIVFENLPALLAGLRLSVLLAVITMLLGSGLGFAVALTRVRAPRPLAWSAMAYTEFFRTTPFLTQILWMYYALPILTGVQMSAFASAVLAFSLNVGAYMSEIFRAGILSVARGQTDAALSLGLSPVQALRRIVLPQAVRNVVPPMASIWLSLFKDTSVASVIAVAEMMYEARALAVNTYRPVEILTVTAVVYFVVVYPQSLLIDRIHEAWLGERRRPGLLDPLGLHAAPAVGGAE